jgi:hypothetical protein
VLEIGTKEIVGLVQKCFSMSVTCLLVSVGLLMVWLLSRKELCILPACRREKAKMGGGLHR